MTADSSSRAEKHAKADKPARAAKTTGSAPKGSPPKDSTPKGSAPKDRVQAKTTGSAKKATPTPAQTGAARKTPSRSSKTSSKAKADSPSKAKTQPRPKARPKAKSEKAKPKPRPEKASSGPKVKDEAVTDAAVARMIRVDHAGEYGAKRIYQGQLAVLGDSPHGPELRHMLEQELEHLRYFEDSVITRRVRPTALHPLWHVFGFALGAGTALMGAKAAMACTVAVEEVIDDHYRRQLEELAEKGASERDLMAAIEIFRAQELEHRDHALDEGARETPFYEILSRVITLWTRGAIFLSERI